jgi:hypothetical protein
MLLHTSFHIKHIYLTFHSLETRVWHKTDTLKALQFSSTLFQRHLFCRLFFPTMDLLNHGTLPVIRPLWCWFIYCVRLFQPLYVCVTYILCLKLFIKSQTSNTHTFVHDNNNLCMNFCGNCCLYCSRWTSQWWSFSSWFSLVPTSVW